MMIFSLHDNNMERLQNFRIQTRFQFKNLLMNAYLSFTHYFYQELLKNSRFNKT